MIFFHLESGKKDANMTKYFRLKVYTLTRGLVYQKDFNVIPIFDRFIQMFVSELVERGIAKAKEQFSALIIPRYDNKPKYNSESNQEIVDPPDSFQSRSNWLTLYIDNGIRPNEPMVYFTIKVCTAQRSTGKYMFYQRDLRISELNYFRRRIDMALCLSGVIKDDEETEHNFYACYDDEANFDKEIVNTASERDDIKMEIHDVPSLDFKKKPFGKYQETQIEGKSAEDDLRILITRQCYRGLEDYAEKQTDPDVESGGILLGQVYKEEESDKFMVEIHNFIPAESTMASGTSLRFTFETWDHINKQRSNRFPDEMTVGWYHTHPFRFRDKDTETPIFLSQTDAFTHKTFFKEPWHVAMVLGYKGEKKGFFQWHKEGIVPCGGFYIYDEVKPDEL